MNTESLQTNQYRLPRWIVIQLLEECNLRCKMCYEWGKEGAYHKKKDLSQLDISIVKQVMRDCSPVKPYYDLFGGEPLLYKGIEEVIEAARYYGSGLDIPTNGTFLEKKADMLVETEPTRLWMSLDGPKEINDIQRGKGVFDKVVKGIHTVFELRETKSKKFPKIGVSFIATPFNYLYIEDLFFHQLDLSMLDHVSIEMQLFSSDASCQAYSRLLQREFGIADAPYARGMIWDMCDFENMDLKELSRQIDQVRRYCLEHSIFLITYPQITTEQNLKLYFSGQFDQMQDKKNRCGLPWIYAEITAKGDVAPCHTYYDFTVGNVNRDSMPAIWNGQKFKQFRTYMKSNLLPICTACSRYYVHNTKNDVLYD